MSRPKNWRKKERWRIIEGFEGRYSVSNMGRVRRNKIKLKIKRPDGRAASSFKRMFIIKPKLARTCSEVGLYDIYGQRKFCRVKNLVGKHWLKVDDPYKIRLIDKTRPFDCSIYNLKSTLTAARKNSALINKKQAQEIKQLLLAMKDIRYNKAKIGKLYKVSPATITLISQEKRWEEIEPTLKDFLKTDGKQKSIKQKEEST